MRIATILLVAMAWSETVAAQGGGRLELWADEEQSSCQIVESSSGLTEIHMFHTGNISAGGIAHFVVGIPECWVGATWVGDELAPGLDADGSSTQSTFLGMIITWGGCRDLPVYLGKIVFAITGQSMPCCEIEVTRPIFEQGPTTIECATPVVMWLVETRGAFVNGSSGCPCDGTVPVEQATWGSIKALYKSTPNTPLTSYGRGR